MRRKFKIASLSIAAIFGLQAPSFAQQYQNPVGMRYVGSQQYMGQNTTFLNPGQRTQFVAPQINSIYAKPMSRVSEIPFYGKNKSTYFYNQKKKNEGPFADSGLYMFAAYSTGENNNGVNLEHGESGSGEADANDSMGTAEGFTLGVGRVMSNTLSVEFMYSNYTQMKFGDWVQFYSTTEEPVLDDEGNPVEDDDGNEVTEEIPVVDDTTYEVVSGGNIQSQFIGIGFKYNLENTFGSLFGRLKPYIGLQLGVAQNTISDYTVSDSEGYIDGEEIPEENPTSETINNTDCSPNASEDCVFEEYYNGQLNFLGASNRSFAYGAEIGFTVELEGNLSIDIFYKMNNFGKVKTSGNMVSTYDVDSTNFYIMEVTDEMDPDILETNPCEAGYYGTGSIDDEYIVCVADAETEEGVQAIAQRRVSSGDMNFYQYGIKLRYMF